MKILMLSGGMDSMYLYQEYKPFDKVVFYDYGQPYLKEEYSKCKEYITDYIKIHNIVSRGREFNIRNIFFFIDLLTRFGYEELELYLGYIQCDLQPFPDNEPEMFSKIENLLSPITLYPFKIITPLKDLHKNDIKELIKLDYYTDNNFKK